MPRKKTRSVIARREKRHAVRLTQKLGALMMLERGLTHQEEMKLREYLEELRFLFDQRDWKKEAV